MTALLLALLVQVRVNVTPTLAPDGSHWLVALNGQQLERVAQGVYLGDLPEGYYLVWVSTAKGDTWWQRDTAIGPNDKPIALDLRSRHVRGTVTFGGRPAGAKLVFGAPDGEHWTMVSGPDGRFSGDLPADSRREQWPVNVVTNGVRRR